LLDNLKAFVTAIQRAKPSAAKGKYVRSAYVSTTMSPSVQLDLAEVDGLVAADKH
jgi:large subunit ribosomal protein L1